MTAKTPAGIARRNAALAAGRNRAGRPTFARGSIPEAPAIIAWFGTARNAARNLVDEVATNARCWGVRAFPPVDRLAPALLGGSDRADKAVGLVEAARVGTVWRAYRVRLGLRDDLPCLPYAPVPRRIANADDDTALDPVRLAWARRTWGTRANVAARLGLRDPARRTRALPARIQRALAGRDVDAELATCITGRIELYTRCYLALTQPWHRRA